MKTHYINAQCKPSHLCGNTIARSSSIARSSTYNGRKSRKLQQSARMGVGLSVLPVGICDKTFAVMLVCTHQVPCLSARTTSEPTRMCGRRSLTECQLRLQFNSDPTSGRAPPLAPVRAASGRSDAETAARMMVTNHYDYFRVPHQYKCVTA
jgi:hypothetical protein